METFTTFGGSADNPTALDVATRVEVQDQLLDHIAESIAELVDKRTAAQETILAPVYKTLVRAIGNDITANAETLAPVGRRILTYLKGRTATTGAMVDHIRRDILPFVPLVEALPTVDETPTDTPPVDISPIGGVCPAVPPPIVVQCPAPIVAAPNVPPGFIPVAPAVPGGGVPIAPAVPGGVPVAPIPGEPVPIVLPIVEPIPGVVPVAPSPRPVPPTPPGTPGESPKPPVVPPTTISTISATLLPAGIDWCVPDPCDSADKAVAKLSKVKPTFTGTEGVTDATPLDVLNYSLIAGVVASTSLVNKLIPGNIGEHVSVGLGETAGRIIVANTTARVMLDDLAPIGLRDKSAATVMLARLGSGNTVANETGIPIDYLQQGEKYLLQYTNPQFIPSQDEIDTLWLYNRITDTQWECYTRAQGNIPSCRRPLIFSKTRVPEILDLIALYRRGDIQTREELDRRMRLLGVVGENYVDEWLKLTLQYPTTSTLQHYNIRDVFDPDKLGLAEMRAEFEKTVNLKELYEIGAMGKFTVRTRDGKEIEVDQAWLDFLSSYDEASPTQTYQMNHRLRPGRVHMFAQTVPNKKPDELRTILPGADIKPTPDGKGSIVTPRPVTMYEIAKNLKEKDYNPIWRDKLAAIAYNVIGRIDLRRLYNSGVFGQPKGAKGFRGVPPNIIDADGPAEKELVERYMDQGSTALDARLLAFYTASEYTRSKLSRVRTSALSRVCAAYQAGVIDRNDALAQTGQITQDVEEATYRVDQCELDHRIKMVKATTAIIKRRYLKGDWDANKVRGELANAGVDAVRIGELMALWKLQLDLRDKDVYAQELCKWYTSGIINRQKMKLRLANLNYSDDDADRIIRHCELGELARTAKVRDRQLKAQAREKKRLLDAMAKEQKEREEAQQKRFTRFLSTRSEKNLKEWLGDGTISINEVRSTLILKGYTNEDAERWLAHNTKRGGTGGTGGSEEP